MPWLAENIRLKPSLIFLKINHLPGETVRKTDEPLSKFGHIRRFHPMGLHSNCENLVRSILDIKILTERKLSMAAPESFIKAVQHEPIPCSSSDCSGYVDCVDISQPQDRIKTFHLHCMVCGVDSYLQGQEDSTSPWAEAELQAIIEEHLLHLQPICPNDQTPVIFTSLPNPRRRARYRIACYYCGRRVEMDWPPPETKW